MGACSVDPCVVSPCLVGSCVAGDCVEGDRVDGDCVERDLVPIDGSPSAGADDLLRERLLAPMIVSPSSASSDPVSSRRQLAMDCGRSFDPRKLTDFRDIKLCSSCLAERSSKLKQRAKKEFTTKTFKQHEWGTVLKLLAAAIALSSLAYFGWTHSHH